MLNVPFQNWVGVVVLTATLGFLVNAGYGSLTHTGAPAQPEQLRFLGGNLWQAPLLWVMALLTSRGAARYLLRNARPTPAPGLRVIIVTTFLITVMEICLETGQYMHRSEQLPVGALAGRICLTFAASLLIQAALTPWLIRKRPGSL